MGLSEVALLNPVFFLLSSFHTFIHMGCLKAFLGRQVFTCQCIYVLLCLVSLVMNALCYSNSRFKPCSLQTGFLWSKKHPVLECLVCSVCRQEDKVLVWRLEGVGSRGDFLFELYGVEKKTSDCKILLLTGKEDG